MTHIRYLLALALMCVACTTPFAFVPDGFGDGGEDGEGGHATSGTPSASSSGEGGTSTLIAAVVATGDTGTGGEPTGGGGSGASGGSGGGEPPPVCSPNQPVCDGNVATACDGTGTDYLPGGIDCAQSSMVCAMGRCEMGLVFYAPLDEGQGTVTLDHVNRLPGVLGAGTTWTDGAFGKAISFDGNTVVDFGDVLNGLSFPVTLAALIWANPTATNPASILATDKQANFSGAWLSFHPEAQFKFSGSFGNGQDGTFDARHGSLTLAGVATGDWLRLTAIIRGPGDIELYADAINVPGTYTGAAATMVHTPAGMLLVGNNFFGVIDDVRVYDRALSPAEVAALP